MTDETKIQGVRPTDEDLLWLAYGKQILKEAPTLLDGNAKSLVTLGSSLLAAYTGALAILSNAIYSMDWILVGGSVILWLISISLAAYVYFPARYKFSLSSPSEILEVTRRSAEQKHLRMRLSAVFFLLALAVSAISILWLGAQMGTGKDQVNLMVSEDGAKALKVLGISIDKDGRTEPLTLLGRTKESFFLEFQGQKVEFDRSLVRELIYLDYQVNIR